MNQPGDLAETQCPPGNQEDTEPELPVPRKRSNSWPTESGMSPKMLYDPLDRSHACLCPTTSEASFQPPRGPLDTGSCSCQATDATEGCAVPMGTTQQLLAGVQQEPEMSGGRGWSLGPPGASSGPPETEFYTCRGRGVLICDSFLLGECTNGRLCNKHHTRMPYHWQLRVSVSKRWASLGPTAQDHLERLYCNPNTDKVTLEDSDGSSYEMDLANLSLTDTKYDRVRRLYNSSNPEVNPHFPAQWKFCWKDTNAWKPYREPILHLLNNAFERGLINYAFLDYEQVYNLDLKQMTLCNAKTGYTRSIRHRPCYRSYRSMLPHLKTLTVGDRGPPQDLQTEEGLYPPTWTMHPWDPDATFLKVPVARADPEYIAVETLFHKTLFEDLVMVFEIYRVQNKFLWQKYQCQKEFMSQGLTDTEKASLERQLFHGTSLDNVDAICRLNFDPRVSGIHRTAFGKGSYFALEASYSHKYTQRSDKGYRHLFVADVLVGKMAPGKAKDRRPPPLGPSGALFDSCVDSVVFPKVFVVFDSCQFYPSYLIQYKLLTEPILLTE